jgi:phage tail-like protein
MLPVSAVSDEHIVSITLDTEMTPDIPYRVTVTGVVDISGNPNVPPNNTAVFTGFRPPRPLTRRFDLWSMLPKHNRRADTTEDLWRFIACLQEITDLLLVDLDRFSDIFDLERAPERFLDSILYDLGDPFPFDLELIDKRRLAAILVEMYSQKGSAIGIKNAIRFFLGLEVEIVPFTSDTLILGVSLLGVDWILGASSRFARYAFNVIVNEPITETQEHQLRAIVNYLRPAHTHFVDLISPIPPPSYNHWEIGIIELGLESDLH